MFRPTRTATVLVSLFAMSLAACKTIYSDVYSPRRNYFKPVQEKTKPTDLLPPPSVTTPAVNLAPPSALPDAPPPAPEMTPPPPAPPAPTEPAVPAIPGL